jgi:acetyl-CoA synthetase
MRDLSRLLNPRTIAVIGGGAWCASIVDAAKRIGYSGQIFPVHPAGKEIAGLPAVRNLHDWPGPIDAAFVGINRHATVDTVRSLTKLGAGGAVCFASGFTEAKAEDETGAALQRDLVEAAGDMPILGPNCYGFINALDKVAIWPDQHGLMPVETGVAILTQSSNIAINLTMQRRALPIAYMVTCGNMAQTSQAEIATALLDDPRVTAIGVHIEGFGDLRGWETLVDKAHARGIPVIALKVGLSDQAQQAAISHTASIAGSDAGAQAFLDRLGIARLHDLPSFLETLKLLHCIGPLNSRRIASISCSGGEASLIADQAAGMNLEFPSLTNIQKIKLSEALGPMVALANPLDYHTYIWRDTQAMAQAWAGMTGPDIGLTFSIVDYPHTDASDWVCATQAVILAHQTSQAAFAVVASLPELMPLDTANHLMENGVVPMFGLSEALAAAEAAASVNAPEPTPVLLPGLADDRENRTETLTEADAKSALSEYGLPIPRSRVAGTASAATEVALGLIEPLAVKGLGLAHKSESGAVKLFVMAKDAAQVAAGMPADQFLIEEMATDGVAELLIGVTRDPAHGFVLTLAAGGIMTEILQDSISLLVPVSEGAIKKALTRLKIHPLLDGYRGKSGADIDAILAAVMAIQAYVVANPETTCEVEVNPLICAPTRAIAVDALIRKAP